MTVGKLTDEQLKNAKSVVDVFKKYGFTFEATCGVIGNLLSESGINPHAEQIGGGGGYGINQWTPKSNLYAQGSKLGLSTAQCETIEGQATILAQCDVTGSWSVAAGVNYIDGATETLQLSAFKQLKDVHKATIDWEVHFGRGYIPTLHMNERLENADWAYKQLKDYVGGGNDTNGKGKLIMLGIHLFW